MLGYGSLGSRMTRHRKLTEKDIEKAILNWLNMDPLIFCWKVNTVGMYDPTQNIYRSLRGFSIKGISDICFIMSPGATFGAIEVKTPEYAKKQKAQYGFPCTPEQKYFIDRVIAFGGPAGVATSIGDTQKILEDWHVRQRN